MGLLRNFRDWLRLRKIEQELTSFAVGINSTVDIPTDKHIVLMDFDQKSIKEVERAVVEAQQFWALSDAFVFSTKHGFHVIFFFDIVPYSRLRMIIDYTHGIDPMFRYISRFYNKKTLRVAGKYRERDIKFLKMVPGVRSPTVEEYALGEMKRREHAILIGENYVVENRKDSSLEGWMNLK